MKMCLLCLLCLLYSPAAFGQTSSPGGAQVVNYPAVEGLPRSADFTVKVRNPGQPWQEVAVYAVKVVQSVDTRRTPVDTSMAAFDFSGTVEVEVTAGKASIQSARVRPLAFGITPQVSGKTLTFSLSQPRNLSVEIDGDLFHNLQLFANPLETSRPDPKDPNVIYFGPGVHRIGGVGIPSGKTVYIAGGALVQGQFQVYQAENVRILGRGILTQYPVSQAQARAQTEGRNSPLPPAARRSRNDSLTIEFSKNVEIDGLITLPTSYTVLMGNSQNVTIKNLKSFSAGGNNDGIDVFCSADVRIDGVFLRNSDDCIAIYGHRWNYYGDVKNVTVQNSTLWADVAHPILVGTHGDSQNPDTIDGLQFRNLDILDQREAQLDYQGCLSLNAGDSNLIRNIVFENVRVEDFREGQLVNLRVMYNKKYNTSAGRGIENVLFKDVTYDGSHANLSVIAGYDETRGIKNVVFENLRINGQVISDDMVGKPAWYKTGDMARFFVGEHVEGLVFRTTAAAKAAQAD